MRMMAFALVAALAGCGTTATTAVSVGSRVGGPALGPGTTVSGAEVSAYSQSSSAALPLLGVVVLGATIYNPAENEARMGSPGLARPTPPLDPGRPVNVQDCNQPISDWSANLKCK